MSEKIKIILFVYNLTTIKEYAFEFARRKECKVYWVSYDQSVINEIQSLGYKEKVYFVDFNLSLFKNDLLKKIQNKIIYLLRATNFIKTYAVKRKYFQIKKEINPDIWIADTGISLSKLKMNELKVNIFHSVCLKKFYLDIYFLKYDLLLLPNHFIKNRLIEYHQLPKKKQKGLKVVGWPRIDNLLINRANDKDNLTFLLKEFNLDINKKTLMYAPTWNSFHEGYIFPKSFGDCLTIFEKFCFEVSKLNINVIVKLHIAMNEVICNKKLRKIAEDYNILFTPQEKVSHLLANNEDYLKITDILVSDLSGIINDFLIFDRPIIYLEPDHPQFSWKEADYPPNFRAGLIANDFNKLIEYVKRSLDKPSEFQNKRKQIKDILFYKMDGNATIRAVDEILNYFSEWKFKHK